MISIPCVQLTIMNYLYFLLQQFKNKNIWTWARGFHLPSDYADFYNLALYK